MKRATPSSAPQEPVLGPADGQGASEDVNALLAQLLRETGCKVAPDDPLVVAALLQSRLVRGAAAQAAGVLRQAAQEAALRLSTAAEGSRRSAEELERKMAQAFAQIADGARRVEEEELNEFRVRLARAASETLERIRHSAVRRSGWRHWWRDPAGLCVGLALGLAGGALLGAWLAAGPSMEQVRLMHNGLLLDAAWPMLSTEQRARLGVPAAHGTPPASTAPAPRPAP